MLQKMGRINKVISLFPEIRKQLRPVQPYVDPFVVFDVDADHMRQGLPRPAADVQTGTTYIGNDLESDLAALVAARGLGPPNHLSSLGEAPPASRLAGVGQLSSCQRRRG